MRAVWLFFDEFEVRQEFRRKAPRVYICPQTRALGRRRQFFSGRLHQIAHLRLQALDDIWGFSVFFRAVSQFWHGG